MEALGALLGILLLIGAVAFYFLPAIVASSRKHGSGGGIFVLNLLAGWTVLGWVAALIWAASGESGAADRTKRCPFCREPVHFAAVVCPHCRRDLEPSSPSLVPSAPAPREYKPGTDVYEIK